MLSANPIPLLHIYVMYNLSSADKKMLNLFVRITIKCDLCKRITKEWYFYDKQSSHSS